MAKCLGASSFDIERKNERSTSMKSIYSSLVALVVFVGQVNSSTRHSIQRGHAMKSAMLVLSLKRREFLSKAAATLFVIATLAIGPVATANDDHGWVASWATSPA